MEIDNVLKMGIPLPKDLPAKLKLSPTDPASHGTNYNVPLMNALVFYIGTQAISLMQTKAPQSQVPHAPMEIFRFLANELDTEGAQRPRGPTAHCRPPARVGAVWAIRLSACTACVFVGQQLVRSRLINARTRVSHGQYSTLVSWPNPLCDPCAAPCNATVGPSRRSSVCHRKHCNSLPEPIAAC
jgi:hypothetical protein